MFCSTSVIVFPFNSKSFYLALKTRCLVELQTVLSGSGSVDCCISQKRVFQFFECVSVFVVGCKIE